MHGKKLCTNHLKWIFTLWVLRNTDKIWTMKYNTYYGNKSFDRRPHKVYQHKFCSVDKFKM